MSDHLRGADAALERLRTLHPKLIDLSLGRIERLLHDLGDPHLRLPPVVHVAGTNGKGSTVAFVRAIAEAAGLRVHVLTSPHLVRFAERIRLAGALISDARLDEVIGRCEAVNAGREITFFEIATAAAFLAMAEAPADLAVIEVGLGGRFDATNVVLPAVSVIAPVAQDHAEFLGTDVAAIAREKAGIIKRGVPVVCAHQSAAAAEVVEAEAARMAAPLLMAGLDWDAWAEGGRLLVQEGERLHDLPPPSLPGAHQFGNAGLACVAALALGDDRITSDALARGVASAVWPARLQRLTAGPLAERAAARGADLWLDGGHNPHAARALADFARSLTARDGRPVVLILGALARKDVAGMLEGLRGAVDRVVATGFDMPGAAEPEALAAAARSAGLTAKARADVAFALDEALAGDGPPPHVVIAGSLYLAGEVLALSPETWPI